MSDLISRSALIEDLRRIDTECIFDDREDILEKALATVDIQPTIEAKPVVRGKWIVKEDEACFATWDYCSVCGFSIGFAGSSLYANFCPNCGARMADMRGVKNG